jgi:hypothetical protein
MFQLVSNHVLLIILSFSAVIAAQTPSEPDPLYPLDKNVSVATILDNSFGERSVGYFTTDEGLAVIDGDVIYGTEAQLLSSEFRSFSVKQAWPGATVVYKYDTAGTAASVTTIVNTAIARWQLGSPYLTFQQLPNSVSPINGVLTISSNACGGCNANIGFGATIPLQMNLQQPSTACNGSCGPNEATHEFGHVLGKFLLPTSQCIKYLGVYSIFTNLCTQVFFMNINALIVKERSITTVKIHPLIAQVVQLCPLVLTAVLGPRLAAVVMHTILISSVAWAIPTHFNMTSTPSCTISPQLLPFQAGLH